MWGALLLTIGRSILAILLAFAGRVSAENAVQWGHLGGSIQRFSRGIGFVGQVVQGASGSSGGYFWQSGFLVHQRLRNHAPVVLHSFLDRQVPSGFGNIEWDLRDVFSDEDTDRLAYRVECPSELVCKLFGDTLRVAARTGGLGGYGIVVFATDPEGAAAIDSFNVIQNKTVIPADWDSLKVYGDPGVDLSGGSYAGWWAVVQDSTIARIDSGWLKWLQPGTVEIQLAAPGADTVRKVVTVKSRLITVKALDNSKIFGSEDPVLRCSVSGLIGSDSLMGRLIRESGEAVGDYAIRQGSLSGGKMYDLQFTGGVFVIRATSGVAEKVVSKKGIPELQAFVVKALGKISADSRAGILGVRVPGCDEGDQCVSIELRASVPLVVSISIFDHQGTHVIEWDDEISADKMREFSQALDGSRRVPIQWNMHSANGVPVGSGVYLWKVELNSVDGRVLKSVLKTGGK